MASRADWIRSKMKSDIRRIYKKVTGRQLRAVKYAGKNVLDENLGSAHLINLIESNKPFMACRYGHVEIETMAAVYEYLEFESDRSLNSILKKRNIFMNAGFFPENKELVIEFSKCMYEWSKQIDMIGVWYIPFEEYFIKSLAPNATMTFLRTYEPWNESIPWTKALKGKKVLVVHPFEQSIQKQYRVKERLFNNVDMLPDFELKTFKAVQTIAGNCDERFNTWFDALNFMYDECMKIDFDIAILGCGAYGFPLACKFKEADKQAIHIGGATQLLFGIKGKRWDNHPVVSKLYNPFWVRPDISELPSNAERVENKCYW